MWYCYWNVSTLSSYTGHICVCDNVPSATSLCLLPFFLWEVNLDSENRKKGPPCDSKTRLLILDSYTHTQPCPCFLQSVQRTPLNPSPQGNGVRGRAGLAQIAQYVCYGFQRLRMQTGPGPSLTPGHVGNTFVSLSHFPLSSI